jgi:hypothetical protein
MWWLTPIIPVSWEAHSLSPSRPKVIETPISQQVQASCEQKKKYILKAKRAGGMAQVAEHKALSSTRHQ